MRVADEHRYLLRLLIIRVPEEVAKLRRADLEAEALRRNRPIRQRAWELADWTILLTDVPAHLLSLQEALVLLGERWQMEILYKLWKQYGRLDEWRTGNQWRILCELYAKLIGLLLQHWLIILLAQAGTNSAVWASWREARPRYRLFSPRSSSRQPLALLCPPKYEALVCVPVAR